jgi:hypothetical protein
MDMTTGKSLAHEPRGVLIAPVLEERRGELDDLRGRLPEGTWANDLMDGDGRFSVGTKGDGYEGQWKAGKKHGEGKEATSSETYSGGFADGVRSGIFGTWGLRDGTHFEGEFGNGLRHGKGRAVLASGDEYDGEWQKGQRHGQGTMIYKRAGDDGVLVAYKSYTGAWVKDARRDKETVTRLASDQCN